MKILIVDDEKDMIAVTKEILISEGHDVVIAKDGEEALKQVEAHKDDLGLILLDIKMPKGNGIEVCRRIKSDRNTWKIPLVINSSYTHDKMVETGLQVGADEYVKRPISAYEMIDLVKKYDKAGKE